MTCTTICINLYQHGSYICGIMVLLIAYDHLGSMTVKKLVTFKALWICGTKVDAKPRRWLSPRKFICDLHCTACCVNVLIQSPSSDTMWFPSNVHDGTVYMMMYNFLFIDKDVIYLYVHVVVGSCISTLWPVLSCKIINYITLNIFVTV